MDKRSREFKEDMFWEVIMDWHLTSNRNSLPWRLSSNPFHIMIAEYLLQQTNVRKVVGVYENIVARYPTPSALAAADAFALQVLLEPLGLHYRCKRIINCAAIIADEFNGVVPNNRTDLLELPGVGPYIADAVLCYGFHQAAVPIDTNVVRIFMRYFGFKSHTARPRTDRHLADDIRAVFKRFSSTRTANFAVLDFAAYICTQKKPLCELCMLKEYCCSHN